MGKRRQGHGLTRAGWCCAPWHAAQAQVTFPGRSKRYTVTEKMSMSLAIKEMLIGKQKVNFAWLPIRSVNGKKDLVLTRMWEAEVSLYLWAESGLEQCVRRMTLGIRVKINNINLKQITPSWKIDLKGIIMDLYKHVRHTFKFTTT